MSPRRSSAAATSIAIPLTASPFGVWRGSRTLACPRCTREARGSRGILFWIGTVVFFPFSLLAFIDDEKCRCQTCGHQFLAQRRWGSSHEGWVRHSRGS